ncbi:hypothetical protein MA9V2_190 [Chryseobacterium phage MA9V-2]|nr:hypothetical protein MA9V2_190 [Chryseobacterium phage MA9V-2]
MILEFTPKHTKNVKAEPDAQRVKRKFAWLPQIIYDNWIERKYFVWFSSYYVIQRYEFKGWERERTMGSFEMSDGAYKIYDWTDYAYFTDIINAERWQKQRQAIKDIWNKNTTTVS